MKILALLPLLFVAAPVAEAASVRDQVNSKRAGVSQESAWKPAASSRKARYSASGRSAGGCHRIPDGKCGSLQDWWAWQSNRN